MTTLGEQQIPVVQDPHVYQIQKEVWSPVGLSFVCDGTKYCTTSAKMKGLGAIGTCPKSTGSSG